mgnify:CR=1 FL=1
MIKKIALLAMVSVVTVHSQTVQKPIAVAPAQKADLCKASEVQIEDALKELAYAAHSGALDNSAPRATNRKLGESVAVSKIQVQLTYMQMLACQPPPPIDFGAYSVHVIGCVMAPAGATASPCDQSKWTRNSLPK